KFALHKEDWLVIQKTYDFLKQFLVLTKETEGDESTLEQVIIAMDYLRVHYDEATIKHAGNTPFLTALQSSRYVYESWYAINDRTPAYQSAILLHPSYRAAYVDHHWPDDWVDKAVKAARSLYKTQYYKAPLPAPALSSP
ncbi:hypothetical protein D6C93_10375, partial [Aureobasidium pullulans]